MPFQMNYDDLNPTQSQTTPSNPLAPAVQGGDNVLDWADKIKGLLQAANEILVNFKELRTNLKGDENIMQNNNQGGFQFSPTNQPPPSFPVIDAQPNQSQTPAEISDAQINAVLIAKAKQIIGTMQKMGYGNRTIGDLYESFKGIKLNDIAATLGLVKDNDTKP